MVVLDAPFIYLAFQRATLKAGSGLGTRLLCPKIPIPTPSLLSHGDGDNFNLILTILSHNYIFCDFEPINSGYLNRLYLM